MSLNPIAVSEGPVQLTRVSGQASALPAVTSGCAAHTGNATTGVVPGTHAAGAGSAAVRASREGRPSSASASANASLHEYGGGNPVNQRRSSASWERQADDVVAHEEDSAAERRGSALSEPLSKGPLSDKEDVVGSTFSLEGSGGGSSALLLLQHMQYLLQAGVSAEVLQQWVSGQLQHVVEVNGAPATPSQPFLAAVSPLDAAVAGGSSAINTGRERGAEVAKAAPVNPRRPAAAVSFSFGSTYPASQQVSGKGSSLLSTTAVSPSTPELALSDENNSLVPTPPLLPPRSPSSLVGARAGGRAASPSSPFPSSTDQAASPVARGAGAAANVSLPSTPPRGGGSLPRPQTAELAGYSTKKAAPANYRANVGEDNTAKASDYSPSSAGRRGSLSLVYPAPNASSPTSIPPNNAGGVGGGLLKPSTTLAPGQPTLPLSPQQQQWRAFPRSSSASDPSSHNAALASGSAARPNAAVYQAPLTSPVKAVPTHTVVNFAPSSATSARRAQESTLYEVTKAALRATTSRLVADEQRNISLLLSERFSRKPESMVRRLATPPSSVSTTLTLNSTTQQQQQQQQEGGGGRRTSSFSAGDSCLPSSLYDRTESPTTTPHARSPTLTKGVATVPLSMGSNFPATSIANGAGQWPLPTHALQHAAGEDAPTSRRRRSFDQRGEDWRRGTATLGPTNSGQSTPADVSTPLTATTTTTIETPTTTPPVAAIASGKPQRNNALSLLHAYSFTHRRNQRISPQSSESVHTLPNSVPGTAGMLTCEQDALFPQHSPLVSPAVSPMAAAAGGDASAGRTGRRPEAHRGFSPPSATGAAAFSTGPDPPLTSSVIEEMSSSLMIGAAKRPTLANVIPLIEVVGETEDGGSMTATTTTIDSSNASANRSSGLAGGVDAGGGRGVARTWGLADAAAGGGLGAGATSSSANGNPATTTLLGMNTSVVSVAWMQSSTSMVAANSSNCSPLTATSASGVPFGHHHHSHQRAVPTYARVASFASNTSSQLGGGHHAHHHTNGTGAGMPAANNAEGRSCVSLGDDVQSFNSSRVSCPSGNRDGAQHTAAGNNRLRRTSVLHLSHTSINGGLDPLMDGVMPDFVLDRAPGDSQKPGPRFMRSYCRHTPVRVAESVTRAALAALDVPYLSNIDEAANPGNVLHLMDVYHYTDGRAFYVVLCLNVLLRYHLVARFAWDTRKLKRFLEVAASFFRDGNPFHHPVHAADVVLGAHQWLSEGTTAASLSDREVAALLLSSLAMHLAHTGVDNHLMTQMRHPYAMLYSFTSPQQGAIVALFMALLRYPELHFFPDPNSATEGVSAEAPKDTAPAGVSHEWTAARESQLYDMVSELVMATDPRNLAAVRQGIVHIAEENAQHHGCLCAAAARSHPSFSPPMAPAGRGHRLGTLPTASPRNEGGKAAAAASTPLAMNTSSSNANLAPDYVCQYCCAYVNENHVPVVLKAVLHYLAFPFLCRSYESYLAGGLMYVAELYRQSGVEYRMAQQQAPRQEAAPAAEQPTTCTSPEKPLSPVFEKSRFVRGGSKDREQDRPSGAFAAAVRNENSSGRQDSPHPENEMAASAPVSRRATTIPLLERDGLASSHGSPPPAAVAGRVRSDSDDVASTETAAPPPPTAPPRVYPLKGHGRDIMLIAVEDLSLPFVEVFAPYMPESWVRSTYLNHQTCMMTLPPADEYDAALTRILSLAEESEEAIVQRERTRTRTMELEDAVPWLQLRRVCPANADWSVNKDGLVRRVIREVVLGTESLLEECEV